MQYATLLTMRDCASARALVQGLQCVADVQV